MRGFVFASVLGSTLLLGGASKEIAPEGTCTPAYFEFKEPVRVSVGVSELSFRLLAIGCRENLEDVWPPSMEAVEREFRPELQEPHPVQTLLMIRDRSPRLRERLVGGLNRAIKQHAVHDVFLFDAKAAE